MIRFVQGNLFDSKAQALVNTVNCVGIMGKGIAHQFKIAYPAMFKEYSAKCRRQEIRLGEMATFREGGRLIINFPTKDHWRSNSRLSDIESGLRALRVLIQKESLTSVAVPPLGCGNGGLDWAVVRPTIERELAGLDGVTIEVFEPAGRPFHSQVAKPVKLSLSHLVLTRLRLLLNEATKLKLQKGAYFFNVFSREDYFKFTEYKYGPYCLAIDPMTQAIRDYIDSTGVQRQDLVEHGLRHVLAGRDVERLRAWFRPIDRAAELCNRLSNTRLEAAATAHAVLARSGPLKEEDLTEQFLKWSPEKSMNFGPADVIEAIRFLEETGLVRQTIVGYEVVSPAAP